MEIEFYQLVSQIIPVLFLGVSLQSVFISRGEKYNDNETFNREIHISLFVFIAVLLCMGEFVALRSTYINKADSNDLFVVIISMSASVAWIILEHILALKGKSKDIYAKGFLIVCIVGFFIEGYYLLK